MEFHTVNGTLSGLTHDINEQGTLVNFGEPLLLETSGKLRFRVGQCVFDVEAKVGHTEGYLSGLVFCLRSKEESAFVRSTVQALMQDETPF